MARAQEVLNTDCPRAACSSVYTPSQHGSSGLGRCGPGSNTNAAGNGERRSESWFQRGHSIRGGFECDVMGFIFCDYRGGGRTVDAIGDATLRTAPADRQATGRRPNRLHGWRMASRTWASRRARRVLGRRRRPAGAGRQLRPAGPTIPFQPWARGLHEYRMKTLAKDDPYPACVPHGGPRQFAAAGGFKILQLPDVQRIYIISGGAARSWREIYMDGRKHPDTTADNSIPATWGIRSDTGRATRSSSIRSASTRGPGCLAGRGCRPPKRCT